jgi:diguanylate cyclase (GGDEF)-like protein
LRTESHGAVERRVRLPLAVKDGLRHRLPHALLATLFAGLLATAPGWAAPAEKLPTITSARQAHDLTSEQAKRGYPIHLRGVVTYFDIDTGTGFGSLYVHDSTGSIFVKLVGGAIKSLPPGSIVDVRGVSDPGGFAPIVDRPRILVIGHTTLPDDAVPVSRTQLFAGEYEGQWVQVEGIVHSVSGSSHTVILELATMDGNLFTTAVREAGADYSRLVDAKVRIRGHEAPLYNANNQMIGARVVFPNLSAIKVIEPAARDPFQSRVIPINNLLRWDEVATLHHRVRLRGSVTMQWPGSSLCIRDATGGLCAQTDQDTHLAPGDVADVVGFAGAEDSTSVLTDAVFRKAGGGQPVAAQPVTAEQVLRGKHNSEMIRIDGQLIGTDQVASDRELILSSGNLIFTAVLPRSLTGPEVRAWKTGSQLRITGICSVQYDPRLSVLKDGVAVPKSFKVLIGSPADVAVLEGPSWWTQGHALVLLALALTVTLVVLAWVVVLRRRVQQKTILLLESEQRFRHMAQHDALTGLATRLVLEDRLNVALERAKRQGKGLALLMLDLDRFKEINDTYGHQVGDEVLRVTSNRIQAAVRKSDTVARMGGDEFVALLPDLSDPHLAESLAAKIVTALSAPIPFAGRDLTVSVSAGVCTALSGDLDADTLLRNTDIAMYEAKAKGRNRFEIFKPEMVHAHKK